MYYSDDVEVDFWKIFFFYHHAKCVKQIPEIKGYNNQLLHTKVEPQPPFPINGGTVGSYAILPILSLS